MSVFSDILKSSLDFLLPNNCLICNKEIQGNLLCHNCLNYIPVIKPPLCKICGRPTKKDKICRFCKNGTHINHGRAWTLFVPPVDKIIHHFKYRKKMNIANLLGRAMANIIKSDFFLGKSDIIVPVPLFWWKSLSRGYNQAALLSETINQECGIKIMNIMKRVKNTKTQTKLDEKARKKNVLNAFTLKTNSIKDKVVLLVDDVLTTGVTMNECARVFKEAGAKKIYSCVAAITPG